MGSLAHVDDSGSVARLGVRLEEVDNGDIVMVDGSKSSLVDEVIAKQYLHSSLL